MSDPINGYALSQTSNGWSYRGVVSDWPLEDGEVFYPSYDAFPQEAKDWFAAHQV